MLHVGIVTKVMNMPVSMVNEPIFLRNERKMHKTNMLK